MPVPTAAPARHRFAAASEETTPIAVRTSAEPAPAATPAAEEAVSPRVPGGAAAALLAAGVGCAAFGVAVVLSESVEAIKAAFTLWTSVGPLSGKAVVAVLIYVLVWPALHVAWRRKEVELRNVSRYCIALLVIGLLGTFPPIYGLIAGH